MCSGIRGISSVFLLAALRVSRIFLTCFLMIRAIKLVPTYRVLLGI